MAVTEKSKAFIRNNIIFFSAVAAVLIILLVGYEAIPNAEAERLLSEAGKDTIESANVGEVVYFGVYEGKAIAWQVLEVKEGYALLLSKDCITGNAYNKDLADTTWEDCSLRKWLNERLLKSFSEAQQANIAQTSLTNKDNTVYGTEGGNDTVDKIFLLSLDEAMEYFPDDASRIARFDDGSFWWLRSPGNDSQKAAYVNYDGSFDGRIGDVNWYGGVRPALWLSLIPDRESVMDARRPEPEPPQDDPGTDPKTEKERETLIWEELYYIPMDIAYSWDSSYWVLDRDGVTIPEDQQFTVLYDVLSGEPQCLKLTKVEENGEDEYGIVAIDKAALFDLDGNMIFDWGEYYYYSGFGDFVVRQESKPMAYYFQSDDIYSELLNFKTGQTHIEGVRWVDRLSDNEALLMTASSRPLGIVDSAGAKLDGFPVDEQYTSARAWNGYILASNRGLYDQAELMDQSFLLTPGFEQILAYNDLKGSRSSELLEFTDVTWAGTKTRGIVTIGGEVLYRAEPGETIYWFNDNFIIVRYSISHEYKYSNHGNYKIVSTQSGKNLYEEVKTVPYSLYNNDGKPSDNLFAYAFGTLWLINKEEGVIDYKDMEEEVSYIYSLPNGLFSVSTENTSMVIDENLSDIIPGGVYDNINQPSEWAADIYEYYDIFVCERYIGLNMLVDLLDLEGRVLVEGLNNIYSVGPDRISVRKGFDVGLMDWQGNWIVKRSLFSELQDD